MLVASELDMFRQSKESTLQKKVSDPMHSIMMELKSAVQHVAAVTGHA